MKPAKTHIAILCSRLDLPGGIERAVTNAANLFVRNGHQVTLLILDATSDSFYPIDAQITVVQHPLDFGIGGKGNFLSRKIRFLRHLRSLRKLITTVNPGVVIGSEYQLSIAARLAVKNDACRIFAWEHHHFHWLNKSFFWRRLTRWVYPKLSAVVCLNLKEAGLYQQAGCKTVVVPNFIEPAKPSPLTAKTILSIGWLIPRKGFDFVIDIGQQVFKQFPDWEWKIIGEGEMHAWLQEMIDKHGMTDNIKLISPQGPDVKALYNQAALFVMTSRFECFPMVLLEAAANGVPAVSFDCPTGPAFIINDGVDGFLVPQGDTQQMTDHLLDLIGDEKKRQDFGRAAQKNAERFAPQKIYQIWDALLTVKT